MNSAYHQTQRGNHVPNKVDQRDDGCSFDQPIGFLICWFRFPSGWTDQTSNEIFILWLCFLAPLCSFATMNYRYPALFSFSNRLEESITLFRWLTQHQLPWESIKSCHLHDLQWGGQSSSDMGHPVRNHQFLSFRATIANEPSLPTTPHLCYVWDKLTFNPTNDA